MTFMTFNDGQILSELFTVFSHMSCSTAHHWIVWDVSYFAIKQEWAEAVLQQHGNFKHLFERDVRYFGKIQLY